MSSSVDCFPIMSSFKPASLDLTSISQNQQSTSQHSASIISPNVLNNNLFEKLLTSQTSDSLNYLAALLPGISGSGLHFQNQINNFTENSNSLSLIYPEKDSFNKNGSKRRNRTTFTHDQATALEKEYALDQYMPRSRRAIVADNLNLTESQVKTWFQNRRAKDKRTDKLNGIQNSNLLTHNNTTKSSEGESPNQASSTSSFNFHNIQKQLTPTFDTNFLMPPSQNGMRLTPSPSSSAASSSHSPLSPLSPNIFNGSMNILNNPSSKIFTDQNNLNTAAALTALYMQSIQLQSSLSSTTTSNTISTTSNDN